MKGAEVQRFKKFRLSLGLSQIEFSKALNIKQGSLSDIERGKAGLSDNVLFKLEKLYNANPKWFTHGEEPMILEEKPRIESIENAEKSPQIEEATQPQPGGEVWNTMITAVTTALNVLSSDNSTFKKIIEDMREDKNTYRAIIETGIGKGAVKFDLKKAGVSPE